MKIQHRILHPFVAMVCVILFSYVTLRAENGKVFFNPDTTRVSPTDTFQVKIEVDNNVKVIHCHLVSVQFDSTLVRLTDVVQGPLLQSHGTTSFHWNYMEGSYDIANCLMGHGIYADGPGVLATMRFSGMGRAGTTSLIFTYVNFEDTLLHDMIVNHRDGAVILSGDEAPSVQVTSPPSGGTYNYLPTLTIHFTDDRGLNRGYYQIDSCTGLWTQLWSSNSASLDTSINWAMPSISQGSHNIYFKVTDDAGHTNVDSCTHSWTFTYDIGRPAVSVTSPASGGIYDSLPVLSIHFTDNLGLNRGYYQIDGCTGGAWMQLWSYNSASSDTTISWTVPSVSQGLHTIYFKAADDAGNINSDTCTHTWNFTYNKSVPAIPLLLTPADSAVTCHLSPTFTWKRSTLVLKGSSESIYESENSSSEIPAITYTLQYSLDPTFTVATTVENIAETLYTVPDTVALTDSTYYWRVEAVDMGTHSGYQAHPFKFKAFKAGDANRDHKITVGDVVYLVNYLFKGGPAPSPSEAGNVNGDTKLTVSDVVYLVNYLFKGGPRPQCRG